MNYARVGHPPSPTVAAMKKCMHLFDILPPCEKHLHSLLAVSFPCGAVAVLVSQILSINLILFCSFTLRACLSKKKLDRKKYAVESKRAKNSSFDVVGSQQILKAFDRKEAVKCVKRNLVPCVHTVGLHCLYCLHEGCVCVRARVS